MTLMEEDDPQAQAAEPLIPIATDVVQVVAPAALPENYALDVTTVGPDGELLSASVVVVRYIISVVYWLLFFCRGGLC